MDIDETLAKLEAGLAATGERLARLEAQLAEACGVFARCDARLAQERAEPEVAVCCPYCGAVGFPCDLPCVFCADAEEAPDKAA